MPTETQKQPTDRQSQLKKAQAEKAAAEQSLLAALNKAGFTNCKSTPQTISTWRKLKNAICPGKAQENQPKPGPKFDFDIKSTSNDEEDNYTHHIRTDEGGKLSSIHIDTSLADKHQLNGNDKEEIGKLATITKEQIGNDAKFNGTFSKSFVDEITNDKNGIDMKAFKDAYIKDEDGNEFTVTATKDNPNKFELTPKPNEPSVANDQDEAEKQQPQL